MKRWPDLSSDRIEVETKIQKDIRKAFERKVGAFEWEGVDFEDKVTAWSYFLVKSAFDYAAIKVGSLFQFYSKFFMSKILRCPFTSFQRQK